MTEGASAGLPYLVRGARVIDPASGTDTTADLLVMDPAGDPARRPKVIDGRDLVAVPGLIDLHTHVDPVGMEGALSPAVPGLQSGVTTVVDAGSAGAGRFRSFLDATETEPTRVLAFINLIHEGLAHNPELRASSDLDVDALVATISEVPDRVSGVKLRAVSPALDIFGMDLLRIAKEVCRGAGIPLMVHLGDTSSTTAAILAAEIIDVLEPGDILTHVLSGRPGAFMSGGRTLHAAHAAHERGVVMDMGHGVRNFSFEVAESLLDIGIHPDTISTDIGKRPRHDGPAHSITETMTKILSLGFSLADVIAMTTLQPADAISRTDLGRLFGGGGTPPADGFTTSSDVSLLRVVEGDWHLADSSGAVRRAAVGVVPVGAFKDGVLHDTGPAPHADGWLQNWRTNDDER
jgi:dihydroorotase